jgi:hypothetical protein
MFLGFTVFNPSKLHLYVKFPNGPTPNSFGVLHTACPTIPGPSLVGGLGPYNGVVIGGGAHGALTLHQNQSWGTDNLKLINFSGLSVPITLYTQKLTWLKS